MGSIGVGMSLLIMFSGGIAMAKMGGHWDNRISKKAYFFYMMTQGMMDKTGSDTGKSQNQTMERMIRMMKIMQKKEGSDPMSPLLK